MFPLNVVAASRSALIVTADKAQVTGDGQGFTICGAPNATDLVTVTAENGKPPYTAAWTLVSVPATSGPYTVFRPTGFDTDFFVANVCEADAIKQETWRCTVTDDLSATEFVDVLVKLTWTDIT